MGRGRRDSGQPLLPLEPPLIALPQSLEPALKNHPQLETNKTSATTAEGASEHALREQTAPGMPCGLKVAATILRNQVCPSSNKYLLLKNCLSYLSFTKGPFFFFFQTAMCNFPWMTQFQNQLITIYVHAKSHKHTPFYT